MNVLKQFNEAMAYIETNLMSEMDMNQIARIAGCSEYHFRRTFSFLTGMSLGEYVRRRRLSLAAIRMLAKGEKVIDVALDLGYETPEAFSKAFSAMHGVSPSRVKKADVEIKAFPPMTFQLMINGGVEMNYRIVEKEAFQIVGFHKRIMVQFKGVNPQMESLTQRLTPVVIADLKSLNNVEPKGMLSVSANFAERTVEGSEVDQYIGVATTVAAPEGYDSLPVENNTWAVFSAMGRFPDALQETWARIYSEWFPASSYELTGGPEMLWNESPDITKADYRSEIWIPVRKL